MSVQQDQSFKIVELSNKSQEWTLRIYAQTESLSPLFLKYVVSINVSLKGFNDRILELESEKKELISKPSLLKEDEENVNELSKEIQRMEEEKIRVVKENPAIEFPAYVKKIERSFMKMYFTFAIDSSFIWNLNRVIDDPKSFRITIKQLDD